MPTEDDPRWTEVPLFGPEDLAALRVLDDTYIDTWPALLAKLDEGEVAPVAVAPAPTTGAAPSEDGAIFQGTIWPC
jgi:hypothetical protein